MFYSTLVNYVCNLQWSGAGYAGSEVLQGTVGNPVEMAQSTYGNSNANTNEALRLYNGSQVYEPWDMSLTAHTTARYDESNVTPSYNLSHYSFYYHFRAYGP
jgi:hypothetical protein